MDEARLEAMLQLQREIKDSLEASAALVRSAMERLEQSTKPEPTCFRLVDAAQRLGVSVTTLRRMIVAKEIRTTKIGRVPMIALVEIHRISAPKDERPALRDRQAKAQWVPITRRR